MDIIKISLLGVCGVMLGFLMKGTKPEYACFITVGIGLVIMGLAVGKIRYLFESLGKIQEALPVDTEYISTLVKMVGITYIGQFASGICKDAGYSTTAAQIELFCKLSVMVLSMPVLMALLRTIQELVRQCCEAGIKVTALPGAVACVTALIISGLPTRRFCFEAFLPTDKKEHQRVLAELQNETRTIVLYEAPHHLLRTLTELYEALGDRKASICRELTKKYETAFRTTLSQAVAYYTENEPKGECVIVIEGKSVQEIEAEDQARWQQMSLEEHMEHYESQGNSRKEAMKLVAKDRGVSKRDVYQALLEAEEA